MPSAPMEPPSPSGDPARTRPRHRPGGRALVRAVVAAAVALLVGGVALGVYGERQRRAAIQRVEATLVRLKALEAEQVTAAPPPADPGVRARQAHIRALEDAERARLRDAMERQRRAGDRAAWGGAILLGGAVGIMLGGLALLRHSARRTRTALRAVRAEERRLRGVLEALPVGVAVAAADGRPALLNRRFATLWGLPSPDGAGVTRVADYARFRGVHAATGTPVAASEWPLARALTHGTTVEGERYDIEAFDGTRRRVLINAAPLRDEGGRVVGATAATLDLTAHLAEVAAGEAALRASEARLRLAIEIARMSVWERDLATDRVMDGAPPLPPADDAPIRADALRDYAGFLAVVHPDDRERVARVNAEAVESGGDLRLTHRLVAADGRTRWVETLARPVPGADGRPARLVGITVDVTERVALEERLRQGQKLEAVGQLAGGIAHDFNNLLTVIVGNLEFARAELAANPTVDEATHGDLGEIAAAADRARTLVRQLLTFSRRQPVAAERLQVGEVVAGAERMLRRVLGDEIALDVHATDDGVLVDADRGQLEQVLMNLAINARDAMLTAAHGAAGTGGTLSVLVTPVTLDARAAAAADGLAPGAYVELVVRDTGHGMDRATRAHAFEPFFTTKAVGTGTGLGLATVHGIVKRAGGGVRLESVPGAGTTVTVWLPVADATDATDASDAGRPAAGRPGTARPGSSADATLEPPSPSVAVRATLLVVEDEAAVRAITRRTLERHGYGVLEARHGADALLLWRMHREVIDAVVTDVRMPELSGRELAATLRVQAPGLPVVFVSGYADEGARLAASPLDRFIAKPYTADALLRAVDEVLGARR